MTLQPAPVLDGNVIAAEIEGRLAALDEVDSRRLKLSAEIETLLGLVKARQVEATSPEGRSLLTVLARADKLTREVARDETCAALNITPRAYRRFLQTLAPARPKAEPKPAPEQETKPETEAEQVGRVDDGQSRYLVENGRICAVTFDRNGGRALVPLCNFAAQITEEIARDDGQEVSRVFALEGRLDTGQPLPRAQVDSVQFAGMRWVAAHWGVRAIVRAGQSTTDKLREAIQLLSQDASARVVYVHTGWKQIGGQRVYLTSGGALGLDGVEVSLDEKLQRYRLPLQPTQAREGMAASLRFLDIGPASVTYPIWAAMYLAPLTPILTPDFVPWAYGPTGSLKSTVLALALCHYGAFTRNTLPASWEATENFLEKLAFLAADAPLCIDDFAPMATHHDAQQMERNAIRIVRAAGNRSGRGRLRSDLAFRPTYSPRGVVLSTGEQLPNGTSVLARIAGIEFAAGSVKLDALTRAQAEAELYPQAMAGYILWLRDQWEHLTTTLPVTWQDLRGRVVGAAHLRVPEFFATLYLALDTGLSFAVETQAITELTAEERRAQGEAALIELAKAQGERVQGERPTLRFLNVLRELLAQGKAFLKPTESTNMAGECLGWQDEDYLYLLSAATYNRVAKFCRDEGGYFPVKATTLHKMLAEEKYIRTPAEEGLTEGGFLSQYWADNKNHNVLKLYRKAANL
ncbi:MAG: DUF927 domain-containing protein [Chloroflexi bacterium]|nr:DUF927 domain-containing protein [Chloroflexota bacterium]